MIAVRRAADRYLSEYDGIVTRHCFSAGAHYDPGNTSFGPLIAVDEHVVAPGSGFARHAHRGVVIVSWVLDGALRHEDGTGRVELIRPGTALLQATGSGIEHTEVNAAANQPLRFVQATLLAGAGEPSVALTAPPVRVGDATFAVHASGPLQVDAPLTHGYVARGSFVAGTVALHEGDSVRLDEGATFDGTGELLVWTLPAESGLR